MVKTRLYCTTVICFLQCTILPSVWANEIFADNKVMEIPIAVEPAVKHDGRSPSFWAEVSCGAKDILNAWERCSYGMKKLYVGNTTEAGCHFFQDLQRCANEAKKKRLQCGTSLGAKGGKELSSLGYINSAKETICLPGSQAMLRGFITIRRTCAEAIVDGVWGRLHDVVLMEHYVPWTPTELKRYACNQFEEASHSDAISSHCGGIREEEDIFRRFLPIFQCDTIGSMQSIATFEDADYFYDPYVKDLEQERVAASRKEDTNKGQLTDNNENRNLAPKEEAKPIHTDGVATDEDHQAQCRCSGAAISTPNFELIILSCCFLWCLRRILLR